MLQSGSAGLLGQQGISGAASSMTVSTAAPLMAACISFDTGTAIAGRTTGASARPTIARTAKMRPKADRNLILQRYHYLAPLSTYANCQHVVSWRDGPAKGMRRRTIQRNNDQTLRELDGKNGLREVSDCPPGGCPWYGPEKTGTGYRPKDETMRAVGLFTHGGPEVLQVVELPEVHAGPGQVRIRVHAATVNPTDVMVRNGARAEQQKADPPPYVPGMEVAGIVDEVGSGVPDRLKVGDAVMAIVVPQGSHGAYREQIVLDARSYAPLPERPILRPPPCR